MQGHLVTTTTTVVKTYFEQSVQSPKNHQRIAEPHSCFHHFHSPTLQRQLGETSIDYLHLMLWFCLMKLPERHFPKHTFTSSACTMISQLQLLILKNTIFGCSHSVENIQLLFSLSSCSLHDVIHCQISAVHAGKCPSFSYAPLKICILSFCARCVLPLLRFSAFA